MGVHSRSARTLLRYWGSHFKSQRQAQVFTDEFRPLVARGWVCHVVVERMPESTGWIDDLVHLGVVLHTEPRPSRNFELRNIRRVAALCRKVRPDLFVCDNIHMSPLLGAAMAGVPKRIWFKRAMNSYYEACRPPTWRDRLALTTRLSVRLSSRVIAVSSAVKEELVEFGAPPQKVHVRLNPRKLSCDIRAISREHAREKYGYNQSDVVIATVGHAVPVKAWDLLLCAFAKFAPAEPRAHLLCIGGIDRPDEVPVAAKLRAETTRLGIESRVRFTGHVTNIPELLRAADIFVLPSRSEGCSNALIEAMEAGLPCVASRVGNATDLIRPRINGLLFPRNDEGALANALATVVLDDALRDHMRNHAQVPPIVPTMARYASQLAQDYTELVGDHAGHANAESIAIDRTTT